MIDTIGWQGEPMRNTSEQTRLSWPQAYVEFLKSPNESFLLKLAPLVIMGIIPADLLSNLLPVVGIVDDVGLSGVGIVVIGRTLWRVRGYRRPATRRTTG
jgi:uncharacterized membrane protein YkvA (DUF1232 family)